MLTTTPDLLHFAHVACSHPNNSPAGLGVSLDSLIIICRLRLHNLNQLFGTLSDNMPSNHIVGWQLAKGK